MTLVVSVSTKDWGVIAADRRQVYVDDRHEIHSDSAEKLIRVSPNVILATSGRANWGNRVKEATQALVANSSRPPEEELERFLTLVSTGVAMGWAASKRDGDERLGLMLMAYDELAGRVRALSTNEDRNFSWEEASQSLALHWACPTSNAEALVRGWFTANEATFLDNGPNEVVAQLPKLFMTVAFLDHCVSTEFTMQTISI